MIDKKNKLKMAYLLKLIKNMLKNEFKCLFYYVLTIYMNI